MTRRPPAVADQTISALIATQMPSLSPIHQRMGEYVQSNMFRAATMRIDELSDAVGASVATANRFARALGFDGYPAFRAALVRGFEATLAPIERLRSSQASPTTGGQVFDATLDLAAANLQLTRSVTHGEAIEAAVEAILAARRVFVLGYGSSAFLAGLMDHGLTPYHGNVQSLALAGGPSHAARHLSNVSSSDLLIAIAFPRYVEDTIKLARAASGRGARVLALTDSVASPLVDFADLTVYVRAERRLAANSDATVLAVIEALCDAVAHKVKHSVEVAMDLTEFVLPWLSKPHRPPASPHGETGRPSELDAKTLSPTRVPHRKKI